jgi:transposase-like protein
MPNSRTPQVLDEAGGLIRKRLTELEEERGRLERALIELGGNEKKRQPGRPPAASNASAAKRPKKRRKGGRADQAVELISAEPGITASAVAKKMKIQPNYLYRGLGELEKEGRVRKEGRKYFKTGQKQKRQAKG